MMNTPVIGSTLMPTDRPAEKALTLRAIARFWSPLAATWLMMSVEGPFIAAIIARLPEPAFNLAAYGVAFAFAMIIEAPIIMIMSAATALVRDRHTFLTLRRFIYSLNALITLVMLSMLVPPVFRFLTVTIIGLPPPVARLSHLATALLLPWPAAIGYRRFYQGVMIRHRLTRRVAYGTVVRVLTMTVTALALGRWSGWPGVCVGALSLSAGVSLEAATSRIMARSVVRTLMTGDANSVAASAQLTTRRVFLFYYPLALTSMLTMGINPLVTFFIGRSRAAVESLAVLPVVTSLVFLFRSGGIAYQEVGIALLGDHGEQLRPLIRFAVRLGTAASAGLMLVAFTPLACVWFEGVSGLPPDLAALAWLPLTLLCLLPLFEVVASLCRAILVRAHKTRLVTWATAIEVATIVATLTVAVACLHLVGAVAASAGLAAGRLAATGYLVAQARRTTTGAPGVLSR